MISTLYTHMYSILKHIPCGYLTERDSEMRLTTSLSGDRWRQYLFVIQDDTNDIDLLNTVSDVTCTDVFEVFYSVI